MPPVGYKAQVVAAMPGTVPEIMARSGMTETTVKRWIRILRAAGESHIAKWKRSIGSGAFQSVHVLGAGQDARCYLQPYTTAQLSKRSRRAGKVDGRAEATQARRSAKYYAKKAARTPHDWAAMLFVAPRREVSRGSN